MRADYVEWVDIELTNFCNIKCPGCLRQTTPYFEDITGKENLSYDFVTSKINKLFLPNLKSINFCANIDEPASHPRIHDLCQFYLEQGVDVHIATNGCIRDTKFWTQLGELCKVYRKKQIYLTVTFALDGTDDETLNKYRVGSNYDRVIKNARAYIDAGGLAQWQFIVFDYNKHQLEEAEKLRKEYGFKKIRIIYSNRKGAELPYERPNTEEKIDNFSCLFEKQRRVQVNNYGEVVPCCYVGAYHLEYKSKKYKFRNEMKKQYFDVYKSFGKELCNSLHYNDIDEVLEGEFFSYMENSFREKPLLTCIDRCGKTNRLDVKLDYV